MKTRKIALAVLFVLTFAIASFAAPEAQFIDGDTSIPTDVSLADSSKEARTKPVTFEWSCPYSQVNEKTFDLYKWFPTDVVIKSMEVPASSVISSYSTTYNATTCEVTLKTRVFDEPKSDSFLVTVSTENYGDYTFLFQIYLTGKYNATISGVTRCDYVYDGNTHTGFTGTPTATYDQVLTYNGSFIYTYAKADGTPLEGAPSEVGNYTVTISIPDDDENCKGSKAVSFEIVEKAQAYYTDSNSQRVETTLRNAVANVPDKGKITLLSDVDLQETIRTDKNFALDGAGHTIKTTLDNHKYFFILDGTVSLENLTLDGGSASGLKATTCLLAVGSSNTSKADVTAENVTIKNNNNVSDGYAGGLNVYGGKFTCGTSQSFTIENCTGDYGGGVTVVNENSSATFDRNAVIKNNEGRTFGGGIYIRKGTVNLGGAELTGNSAVTAGAIRVEYDYALNISGETKIHKNTATYYGAGVWYGNNSSLHIQGRPYIAENTSAEETNGGLYPDDNSTGHTAFPIVKFGNLESETKIAICSYNLKHRMVVAEFDDEVNGNSIPKDAIYYNGSKFKVEVSPSDVYLTALININIGKKSAESNVRYVASDISQEFKLNEESGNETYIYECGGEKYVLFMFTEKASDDTPVVIKSQFFLVDVDNLKATKLDLDTYTQIYDETTVRADSPLGLRFKASISTKAKQETETYEILEYGFLITTKEMLSANTFRFENLSKYVSAPAYVKADGTDVIYDSSNDDYDVFTGVLYNIPEKQYKTDLACRTYTKIKIGDNTYTMYGEPMYGNLYDAAQKALTTTTDTNMKKVLSDIISVVDKTPLIDVGDMYN